MAPRRPFPSSASLALLPLSPGCAMLGLVLSPLSPVCSGDFPFVSQFFQVSKPKEPHRVAGICLRAPPMSASPRKALRMLIVSKGSVNADRVQPSSPCLVLEPGEPSNPSMSSHPSTHPLLEEVTAGSGMVLTPQDGPVYPAGGWLCLGLPSQQPGEGESPEAGVGFSCLSGVRMGKYLTRLLLTDFLLRVISDLKSGFCSAVPLEEMEMLGLGDFLSLHSSPCWVLSPCSCWTQQGSVRCHTSRGSRQRIWAGCTAGGGRMSVKVLALQHSHCLSIPLLMHFHILFELVGIVPRSVHGSAFVYFGFHLPLTGPFIKLSLVLLKFPVVFSCSESSM